MAFCASISFADITNGLVAYYPFEGDANDASGNGWHGSNHTGTVEYGPFSTPRPGLWPTTGKRGQAAWFDGQSCISLPQPRLLDGASNATICAWVWFSSGESGQIIGAGDGRAGRDPITTRISATGAEDCRFIQVVNDEQTLLGFSNGESIRGLSVGDWHLFTMVLGSRTNECVFRCYVDTSLVKDTTSPSFSRIAYDADMSALIGALDATSPNQFWKGVIDELRIYDRALTRNDILELFHREDAAMMIEVSHVRVCWFTPTNKTAQLQYRSVMTSNGWVNLGAPVPGTGYTTCITDAVDGETKFYRVVYMP